MTEDDKYLSELYRLHLVDPTQWVKKAMELIASADLFVPFVQDHSKGQNDAKASGYYRSYLMLAAFALENLFKAVIVKRNSATIHGSCSANPKLPEILHSHELDKLAETSGLSIGSEDTRNFLKYLSREAIWNGRYPLPMLPRNIPACKVEGLGPGFVATDLFADNDVENVRMLVDQLIKELEKMGVRTNA